MDFVTGLPILIDLKRENYDLILIIVNWLTKMVHYKPVKVIINALGLVKVIIYVVMRYYNLPDLIVTNWRFFFTLKFWSSLCYFLKVKQKLSTAFYLQINGQTKKQNNTSEAYFLAFVNFEQNDWAWLLLIVEFAYNNAKNASTGHTFFKLNCEYHLCIFYEKDLDFYSKSKIVKELSFKLPNLMAIHQQNLYHTQKLWKQAYDKRVKLQSYVLGDKV